jgi:tetratricopeptide (TPR) repeat protein
MTLLLLLTAGALACGGGDDPTKPDPQGNNNTGGATLIGRVLDREGTPQGGPWTTVKLSVKDDGEVAPAQAPTGTGPDAGTFEFIGLPMGIALVLEIDLFQVSLGRNLGYIQQVTLTSSGTYDLGDIVLENDFLDNGWSAYITKDYSLAILNFERAFEDRFIQANLSYSSSAYTGLGWVYAKRGKDNQTGITWVDADGEFVDTMNSYEWDQAINQFDRAITNSNDSDAYVGMAGTYLTLLGQSNKDPVLLGPWIPFYGFVSWYFDDAQAKLNQALLVDPDYNCPHDEISADDLRATLIFLRWIQGKSVSLEEVTTLADSPDLNQGSRQLLSAMPDLIEYNPYPQL